MPNETLQKIRSKYPQYADVDDSTLAARIMAKYPQYQDLLGDVVAPKAVAGPTPEPSKETIEWGDVPGMMAENALPSMARIATALVNPQTYSGLAKFVVGAARASAMQPPTEESDMVYRNALKGYAERYGTEEGIKDALAKDPAGVLADVSSLFSGAGAALKAGGLARDGGVVSKIGAVADPLAVMGRGVKMLIPQRTASKIYQSAIKPSVNEPERVVSQMIARGLDEKIPVTEKGLGLARKSIADVQKRVDDVINSGSARGDAIPIDDLLSGYNKVIEEVSLGPMPELSIRQVNSFFYQELETLLREHPNGMIPTAKAQAIKKKFNAELAPTMYNELKSAQKRSANEFRATIKSELEKLYPEIKQLNETNGARIQLEEAIYKRLFGEINRMQTIPMQPSAFGGTALAASYGLNPQAMLFAGGYYEVKRMLNLPGVKSRLAIALNEAKRAGLRRGRVGGAIGTAGAVNTATQEQ